MKKIIFIIGLLFSAFMCHAEWIGDFWKAEPVEIKISEVKINSIINNNFKIQIDEDSITDGYKWFIQIEKNSKNKIKIITSDTKEQKEVDNFEVKFIEIGNIQFRLIYANINNHKDIKEIINYTAIIKKPNIEFKWYTDFDSAKVIAKQQDKPILLLFTGSDWCGACKVLERDILETEEFKNFAKENFILVKMDYLKKSEQDPEMRKQIDRLRFEFNQSVFPCTFILDCNGKEIGMIKGAKKNYIELLKDFNNK